MIRRPPWSLLGIAATSDTGAIRKAYAAHIKAMDLDRDVEGYAALRHARDTALRMAKAMAVPPDEVDDAEPAGDAQNRWLHAAPDLAGDWEAPAALSVNPGDPAPASFTARVSPDFSVKGTGGEQIVPAGVDPFDPPLVLDAAHGGTVDALKPDVSPFERLGALIDADCVDTDKPLRDAEEAESLRWLQAVFAEVRLSNVSRQAQIEDWLANLLAEAWPRCAPLLEAATAEFGWEREWGTVAARPAVDYLGPRLRGYRFQQKVLQPGHRYHKAWIELCRPGPAEPFSFLRASSSDVHGLLDGIRKHFPEQEEHFDFERVRSWEKGRAWLTGAIIVFGLLILGFLVILIDPKSYQDTRTKAIAATIAEAFGSPRDRQWLVASQPDLSSTLFENIQVKQDGSVDEKATIERGLEIVRIRTYLDGRLLGGEDFEKVMKLRLSLLKAAQADSSDACRRLLTLGAPPASTPIPPEVRDAERRFAARLAEQSLLTTPEKAKAQSAKVPGELVAKVMAATKLSQDHVAQALQGKGSDTNRCAVAIALLEATLDWKGDGRKAILMTL